MALNTNIRKIWVEVFEVVLKRPIVILPFFIVAFFEGLALELTYFSCRKPLLLILGPVIRKFSGEPSLHYPINLLKLPGFFYYSQILIYIFAGVFLAAITVNILKNIRGSLPLKTNALIKNAAKRYFTFVMFGIIVIALMFLLKKGDTFIYTKFMQVLPQISPNLQTLGFILFLFLTNVILQTFFVLVIPILVIRKASLLKALGSSIAMGFRNFFSIFTLILVPFIVYLPIILLKSYSGALAGKTFPEISLYIVGVGIIATAFVECIIIVCATHFLLEKEKKST
ncbi:MAG: hypothetical protein NG712_04775 [Omnitrophica bacterium]|nr:hypothetical protein [Candidatus Omnitrophota bacterium]